MSYMFGGDTQRAMILAKSVDYKGTFTRDAVTCRVRTSSEGRVTQEGEDDLDI